MCMNSYCLVLLPVDLRFPLYQSIMNLAPFDFDEMLLSINSKCSTFINIKCSISRCIRHIFFLHRFVQFLQFVSREKIQSSSARC